jgi:hypoxanthine-guanine phosphoribosyltransferase
MERLVVIGHGAEKSVGMLRKAFPNSEIVVVDDVRDLGTAIKKVEEFRLPKLIQEGAEKLKVIMEELKSVSIVQKKEIRNQSDQMRYRVRHFNSRRI